MSAVLPNLNPLAQLQSSYVYPFWLVIITILGLTGLTYRLLNRRNGEYSLTSNHRHDFQNSSTSQDRHTNSPSRDIAPPTPQPIEAEYSQTTSDLKQLQTQLQGLADNLPGVIYHSIVTPEGKEDCSYISPGCRDLYGFEPEAMMQNPQLMWDAVLPEDLEGLRASIEQSKSTLQPWRWQGRIYTSQGTVKWIQGILSLACCR
jgi:PAS domain-containing protein